MRQEHSTTGTCGAQPQPHPRQQQQRRLARRASALTDAAAELPLEAQAELFASLSAWLARDCAFYARFYPSARSARMATDAHEIASRAAALQKQLVGETAEEAHA